MNEDVVVDHAEQWLSNLPNVASIQRNQIIITGGLEADLVGSNSAGEIVYIVECKGSVGLNQITQGIGQTFQYVHQKALSKKAKDAQVLFILPRDVSKTLDRLQVPKRVKVLLVTPDGRVSERVRRRQGTPAVELQLPNTFYIRDCEINHFKDILLALDELSRKTTGPISEKAIRREIHRRRPEIAANGYNHLITLRSIGVLGASNRLTPKGYHLFGLLEKADESFSRELSDQFYCFLVNVMNAIVLIANEKKSSLDLVRCTHKEIAKKICQVWGQTVRFMYDSRTISTAMRILRELGALDFTKSQVSLKKLVHPIYLP